MCQPKSHRTKDKLQFSSHCTCMEIYPDSRSDKAQKIYLVKYLSWERTKVSASWKYLTFARLALEVASQIWWKCNKKIAERDLWLHVADLKPLIEKKVIFPGEEMANSQMMGCSLLTNQEALPIESITISLLSLNENTCYSVVEQDPTALATALEFWSKDRWKGRWQWLEKELDLNLPFLIQVRLVLFKLHGGPDSTVYSEHFAPSNLSLEWLHRISITPHGNSII